MAILALAMPAAAALAQSQPSHYTSATRYDAMGRVTGTISPDPDGSGSQPRLATRTFYNPDGTVRRVEQGALYSWQDETRDPHTDWGSDFVIHSYVLTYYDAMGRKTHERVNGSDNVTASVTQYSYDALGRLECTAVRMRPVVNSSLPASACTLDPGATTHGPDRITKTLYDAAGQVLQVRRAVGTSVENADVTYSYTPNGKIKDVIDANGNRARLEYDGHDRQSRWIFPAKARPSNFNDATPATALASAGAVNTADYEQYGYDASGNRTSFRKRDGRTITYRYDALNRMTRKIIPDGNGLAATHTRDVWSIYDLLGNPVSVRFDSNSGEGLSFNYDGFGRLKSTNRYIDGASRSLGFAYDVNGNRTRIVNYSDNAIFDYTYDRMDRPDRINGPAANGLIDYSYDYVGQTNRLDRYGANSFNQYFAHDRVSRLSAMSIGRTSTTPQVRWDFTRNPASQITSETRSNDAYAWDGHVDIDRSYTTNGLNQYTGAGPASFAYDANGNLTSDGTSTYTYDVENRLVQRTSPAGTVTLRYDPLGRLHEVSGPTEFRRFLWDGDAMVAEYGANAHDPAIAIYVHGTATGVDDPLVEFGGGTVSLSTARFLYADPRGSIVFRADVAGSSDYINTYDEYGIPGAGNAGRFQYTGQMWLKDLGMYHYKARIYSPTLGRFLQTDPIGYEDQRNLYAYVANDPINGIDPFGLAQVCTATTRSRIRSAGACVTVDADFDKDGNDDLTRGQLNDIGDDFSSHIVANDGANLGDYSGPPVEKGAGVSVGQAAFVSVVTQFVANSSEGRQLLGRTDSIYVGRYRGSSSAPGHFAPDRGFVDAINGARGSILISPSFRSNFSSASNLARIIAHEANHPYYGSVFGNGPFHSIIDNRARSFIRRHGLDGGGCLALIGFPSC